MKHKKVGGLLVHQVSQATIDGYTSSERINPFKNVGSVEWVAWNVGKERQLYNKRMINAENYRGLYRFFNASFLQLPHISHPFSHPKPRHNTTTS